MLELAIRPFYNHGETLGGVLLVILFCGSCIVWMAYVAWINFGPPAKRRARDADRK